jgi:hypothetical protein
MVDTRRAAFVAAIAVALVALAGCGAFTSGAETNLLLVNNDDATHDVTVEVVDDGDAVVVEEQQSVEPETDNEFGSVGVNGAYTVRVTVDGETTERTHEFGDGGTLSIGIQNDGTVIVGG